MSDNAENTIYPPDYEGLEGRQPQGNTGPWELFPTLTMTAFIGFAIMLTSTAIVYLLFSLKRMTNPALTFEVYSKTVKSMDSLVVGMTSIGGAVVAVLLIFFFVRRRQGITPSEYLGLTVPRLRVFTLWLAILFIFMVISGMVAQQIGQSQQSSKFTINLIKNSQNFWLIVIAVVIAAPLLEEFVMRGFLFEGLLHARFSDVVALMGAVLVGVAVFYNVKALSGQSSVQDALMHMTLASLAYMLIGAVLIIGLYWLAHKYRRETKFGAVGTVLLTAIFWSLLHNQYQWFNLTVIAVMGIIFGVAKLKTKSLYVPIFLHAAQNGLAVMAVSLYLGEKTVGAG